VEQSVAQSVEQGALSVDRRPYPRALLAVALVLAALAGLVVADRPAGAAEPSALVPAAFIPIGRLDNTLTGVQVQNPTGARVNVSVRWVNPASGDEESRTGIRSVAGAASTTFLRQSGGHLAAQVLADGPVTVTVNHMEDGRGVASSPGFTRGARKVFLPLLLRNHFRFSTRVAIQNVSTTATAVHLIYVDLAGTPLVEDGVTLPPSGAHVFGPPEFLRLPVGDGRFTARIEADSADVVATVLEEGDGSVLGYGGLAERMAGSSLSVPLVAANNYGNYTGIQLVNVGSEPTTVVVTFGPNVADESAPVPRCGSLQPRPVPLASRASRSLLQRDGPEALGSDPQFATCRYIGSATVTNADGQPASPLLAIVNQTGPSGSSAYEVVGDGQHGRVAQLPLLQSHNYGIGSGVQVQNVGSTVNSASFTYGDNSAGSLPDFSACPTPLATQEQTKQLNAMPAGGSVNILQTDLRNAGGAPCVYVGSAIAEATGSGNLAAIVNQLVPGPFDKLATYVTAPW
jgi:hypothetical protein